VIAVRRLEGGIPSQSVEVVAEFRAKVMFERGEAVPANSAGIAAAMTLEDQHVEDDVEVPGLTDNDPEFFEKQKAREDRKDMRSPTDRMHRGGKRK
jgi:hypothetical protein